MPKECLVPEEDWQVEALGRAGLRAGTKAGTKGAAKIGAKALGKGLLKKIPLLGLGAGALFAAERAMAGDFAGAGLELASGAASTVPGFGTAASVGIDAALAGRDMGLTPFASGGIITKPTASLMGEAGKEGVFPLEGSKGKKTFLQFGEGILEAQRKNKTENAKRMAEGLGMYYDKQNGWEKFMDALADFIKSSPLAKFFNWGDRNTPGAGPGGKVGDDLFSTISGGEGGIDSYNTGNAGSQAGYTPPKPISQMTVGQIMDDQASGSLFAVGKYQIIPSTMKDFVKNAGISRDDIFNEETQDKFKDYVVNTARPDVGKFLTGAEGSSLEKAQMALAAEFASVGVPRDMKKGEYNGEYPIRDIKKGESLYSGVGGNAASISPEVIAEALNKEKSGNADNDDNDADKTKSSTSKEDWTKGMPDYGLQADPRKSLSLGGGIFARRIKTLDGEKWKIYKSGILGPEDVDTVGKNEWIKPKLEEAGKKYLQSQPQASTSGLTPPADSSTALATKSTDLAMANTGGTTVINNTYVTGSQSSGGGNSPGNVPMGISSRETGTSAFSEMRLRTIG